MNKKTKKEIKAIYQEIARLDSLIHESKEKPTKEPINSLHDYEVKGETEIKTNIKSPDVIGHEKEIDWNVPGQIMYYDGEQTVVLTLGKSTQECFSAICIATKSPNVEVWEVSSAWCKVFFKLSNKTLKLE